MPGALLWFEVSGASSGSRICWVLPARLYGWSFESPDVPGLAGGSDDGYDAAHAEQAARFALACVAEEQGLPVPVDLIFEHYVPAGVAVAA